MKPLIITGTCKELCKCENLLRRFGYTPFGIHSNINDNHETGYLYINREGEFTFSFENPLPNYSHTVTASDFMKNYGLLGIKTCYTFKNLYFAITLILLMTGIESSAPNGRLILIGLFALNIIFHWGTVKEWLSKLN